MAIALPNFLQGSADDATLARGLTAALAQELAQNRHFAPVDSLVMSGLPVVVDAPPDFAAWRRVGAEALVTGLVSMRAGRIRAGFRLWDTTRQLQLTSQLYRVALADAPELAHMIAAAIVAELVRPARPASLCKLL
jgi:TolB protein